MNYTITNRTKGKVITERARFARSFFKRMFGYMFRARIEADDALIFYSAPSMHMFFMRFPLDIVFLDKSNKVIRIFKSIGPWRLANCFQSKVTIEFSADVTTKIPIELGDILDISAVSTK